jgi:acetyltransferase-like isoleucine patch superfamily enzyme
MNLSTMFHRLRVMRFHYLQRRRKTRWLQTMLAQGVIFNTDPEILGRSDYESLIRAGKGSYFERDLTFWLAQEQGATPSIDIGARVYVGRNCYLGSYAPLKIGDDCGIGAYSYIITANHRFRDATRPVSQQGYESAPVELGQDVWLGCHVVVLPGVTIGNGSVIGAGAVVTKSVPPREVWAGVPAKKVGVR